MRRLGLAVALLLMIAAPSRGVTTCSNTYRAEASDQTNLSATPGSLTPTTCAGGSSSLLAGLVSYWPLSESSGTRSDTMGANPLTDNNTVASVAKGVGAPANLPDTVALFVRANSEYLSTANTVLGADSDFTMALWIYTETQPATMGLFNDATGDSYGLLGSGNIPQFFVRAFNDSHSSGTVTNQTWTLLIFTYNHTTDTLGISKNGGALSTAVGAGANGALNTFFVGSRSAALAFFDGRISTFGLWSRVITTAEIACYYNSGNATVHPFTGVCS